jgi:predicted RNA binding protein YcfA (HicA-like mRNA interferase family)
LKLPRDISGIELTKLLHRYGYEVTRQTGSHVRLSSSARGAEHHITIPAHKSLKVGMLSGILSEVSRYLEMPRDLLEKELFGN